MRGTATRVATLSLPKTFPSCQKKYLTGSRSDLRVPYREITLSPTHHSRGAETNSPLPVYGAHSVILVALSILQKDCRSPASTGSKSEATQNCCMADFRREHDRVALFAVAK
jgi:phosphomethylpyrimidine synthase